MAKKSLELSNIGNPVEEPNDRKDEPVDEEEHGEDEPGWFDSVQGHLSWPPSPVLPPLRASASSPQLSPILLNLVSALVEQFSLELIGEEEDDPSEF